MVLLVPELAPPAEEVAHKRPAVQVARAALAELMAQLVRSAVVVVVVVAAIMVAAVAAAVAAIMVAAEENKEIPPRAPVAAAARRLPSARPPASRTSRACAPAMAR